MIIALTAGSCLKKESGCNFSDVNITAPAQEQADVEAWLSGQGINAVKHASGLYYEIINAGSGATPNLCSQVQVAYTGRFTNGTVFDQSPPVMFVLGGTIEGWKKGLPLIKEGGRIKLYIPPALGYGNTDQTDKYGTVIIPAGSILVFDVELHAVN